MTPPVAVVGAGRMGRGIALSYIFAGVPVVLIDLKERSPDEQDELARLISDELTRDLKFLADIDLICPADIEEVKSLVNLIGSTDALGKIYDCRIIFEAVPEVMSLKIEAIDYIDSISEHEAVLASTTSTFLVNDLAVKSKYPERFLNAHWLNPAHLIPLVEVSKGDNTSEEAAKTLVESLESIGKVPIVCTASAGYIVPRIQALAMNEAARLVEEGVASAEDVDKAVNLGFGLRFSVLGLLEFIDWGGGDILYYASNYLAEEIDDRYRAPEVVSQNMKLEKRGIRDGVGFFDYKDIDLNSYRDQRMKQFVDMLRYKDLLPVFNRAK